MFRELPAWGIYIRHASDILITHLALSCIKKDYRTAIVLDDVHHSRFITMDIKEPGNKKAFYQHHYSELIFK